MPGIEAHTGRRGSEPHSCRQMARGERAARRRTCMQLVNMTHTDMSLEKTLSSSGLVSMQSFRQLSRKLVWWPSTSSMLDACEETGPHEETDPSRAWLQTQLYTLLDCSLFSNDPVAFEGKFQNTGTRKH